MQIGTQFPRKNPTYNPPARAVAEPGVQDQVTLGSDSGPDESWGHTLLGGTIGGAISAVPVVGALTSIGGVEANRRLGFRSKTDSVQLGSAVLNLGSSAALFTGQTKLGLIGLGLTGLVTAGVFISEGLASR